jgi:hypothetical protein
MFALFKASMVAVSSDWRSGVRGKPAENMIRVLRPAVGPNDFASSRMESNTLRAAKSDSVRRSEGAPSAANCALPLPALGFTPANFTLLTARFSISPSAVKFWAILKLPSKSTTAI